MKIVYFGNNLFSSCLKYLLEEGHQIQRVYKNYSPLNNSNIDKICEDNSIPAFEHKPNLSELNHLVSQGIEMFIVAEYSYLVPETNVQYALNIHPTLLPNGRGPTPLPYLINSPEFSGVTIHKLSSKFDSGDIILQSQISHFVEESLTTLMIKIHLESVELLKVFFEDVDKYYKSAIPQNDYSYWPRINGFKRVLDWNLAVENINVLKRSFGHMGLIIKINNELWITSHMELFEYKHGLKPGNVIFEDDYLMAVTCLNGIVTMHKKAICRDTT